MSSFRFSRNAPLLSRAMSLRPSARIPVTLYDYETRLPGKSISPACMKVRVALNYKKIPHKTFWMKRHEIGERARALGLPANITEPKPDGTFKFTVPILEDPTTDETVSDSIRIVDYLDRTYPDTPRLITPGTEVLLVALQDAVLNNVMKHLYAPVAARVALTMDDLSSEKYRERVEAVLGLPIEEFLRDSHLEDPYWFRVRTGFDALDRCFEKAELVSTFPGSPVAEPWVGGEKLGYADLIIAAPIFWAQRALGEEHPRWKELVTWNGGRWGRLHASLKPYARIYG